MSSVLAVAGSLIRASGWCCDNIAGMPWGEVELEPEVNEWLEGLDDQRWGQAMFHLDLLEERAGYWGSPTLVSFRGSYASCAFTAAVSESASRIGSRRDAGSSC